MPGPLTIALAVIGAVLAARDPRRMLPGVLLTLAALSLGSWVVSLIVDAGDALVAEEDRALVQALTLVGVPLLMGLLLGLALVANGILMLRREARSLGNLLSLAAGLAIVAAYGVAALTIADDDVRLAVLLLALALPVAYLGIGLLAFLAWSLAYGRIASRAPIAAAVVVLGSGLVRGRVPPLLASRVARGVGLVERSPTSLLVLSGGQGADEPRSEASAMAEHARSLGVRDDRMLLEEASSTTRENLILSQRVLAERALAAASGARGPSDTSPHVAPLPVTVVSSDYHALRAATLMRRLGIPGHAIGARTARYYLPSALLREYVALLRDHTRMHAVAIAVLLLPFAALVVAPLMRATAG